MPRFAGAFRVSAANVGISLGPAHPGRAFGVLSPGDPVQRRSVIVRTAFQGPDARDGFEAVTRAVSDGRYTVDPSLVRPVRGSLLQSFVFEVGTGQRSVTLLLREGFVTEAELAQRLLAVPAGDVYDVAD